MKTIEIKSLFCDERGTVGVICVDGLPVCYSMELPWKDNKCNISCIPKGEYKVVLEWSAHFGEDLYEIYGIDGRSECKFHVANYMSQILGCVATGAELWIDNDGKFRTFESGKAFRKFMDAMDGAEKATLIVSGDRP